MTGIVARSVRATRAPLRVWLCLPGLVLALLAAPAGAAAQDCTLADPPCPLDAPPSVGISPEGGVFTQEEIAISIWVQDDRGYDAPTFSVTSSAGALGDLTLRPTGTNTGQAHGTFRMAAGVDNVVTARICDIAGKCETISATFRYAPPPPPPPPPAKAEPEVSVVGPPGGGTRLPSAFDAGLGYTTPAYVSLDVPRSVSLAYSSELASPTAFVQVDATPNSGTVPERMSISIRDAAGKPVRFTNGRTENFYGPGITGPTRLAAQWDASAQATGAYTYTVVVRNWWGVEFRETRQTVRVLVVNERQSPVGAGWMVAGLQRIHAQPDGALVLAQGDGSVALFAQGACDGAGCQYTSPAGDFSSLAQLSGGYRRTLVDGGVLTYAADGRLTAVEDRLGNRLAYGYDAARRLVSVTDPLGLAITLAYDAAGKLASIRDPGGRQVAVSVNRAGDLVAVIDPDGQAALRAHYDAAHRVATHWDRTGGAYTFSYDHAGRLASTLLPGVQTEEGLIRPLLRSRSWEAALLPAGGVGSLASPAPRVVPGGARAALFDARGDSTRLALDRWGMPERAEDSRGRVTTWTRNDAGQVTSVRTPRGGAVLYRWAGPNLVETGNQVTGSGTVMEYNQYGQVTRVTQEEVLQSENFYGARGQLDSVRVDTTVTRFTYDARGRVLTTTDPEGHRTSTSYQGGGMQNTESLSLLRGSETRTTTFAYDALGRVRRATDPSGASAATEYDPLNRTVRVDGPDSTGVRYGYDDVTRTYTVTDSRNQTYRTVMNTMGWVESRTDPRGGVERYAYDRGGNVTRYTNRRLQQVTFTYDTQDRVRTRAADGRTTSFDYDTAGAWTAVSSGEGTDTLRADPAGRAVEAVTVRGGIRYLLQPSYTEGGFRNGLTVTGPWGTREIVFGPDEHLRLKFLHSFGHGGAGFKYTRDDLLAEVNLPTGTSFGDTARLKVSFGYTPLHATESIRYNRSAAEQALGRTYGYDALERIQSILRRSAAGGTETRTVAYDALGRLAGYADVRSWITLERICEDPADATTCTSNPVQHTETLRSDTYTYDRAGNRTDRGAVLETGNRLTSFGGYTMEYDADGNLVRKFQRSASGAITFDQRLAWSSLGELESVTTNGSATTFGYDGLGRRVRKSAPGGTTRYLWDGDDLVAELDAAGGLVREYAYYPGIDQPHAMRRASDGAVFFYTQELPGHVAGLVARGNSVVNQYTYTPWGEPLSTTEQVPQPLRYAARELDAETGLYYVRARYYDPQQGRFVSQDPIGLAGGLNPYVYGGNNPVKNGDPTGLWCEVRGAGTEVERLHCEDIRPGDFHTIRNYLGGAAGQSAFEMFAALGWTAWSAATCRGGFSESQCSDIAKAQSQLTLHSDAQCRTLGASATRRFQRGHYRYSPNATGWVGMAVPVFSREVWIAGLAWTTHKGYLQDTIAHEEAHHRYWLKFALQLNWFNHDAGGDFIYDIGNRCG